MAKASPKGWVKVHRQITENIIWESPEPFDRRSAWIDLIMMANHEKREFINHRGKTITLQPGQLLTSTSNLALRWHWSVNKVRRYLRLLNEQGMCTMSGTADGTTLTLVKYGIYQGRGQADGIAHDTAHDIADGTADGIAHGTRTRMYKNVIKNDKESKEKASPMIDPGGYEVEE